MDRRRNNMDIKIIINTDTLDSFEGYVCKYTNCSEDFVKGSGDVKKLKYCPLCGTKIKEIDEA
jgi:hypothetical protein